MLVYTHPTCSTCKRVHKQLKAYGYEFELVDIRETTPTVDFFKALIEQGVSRKKMLNTSGTKYKEMQLKDKVDEMSDEAFINLLVSDGMLIKRPIIIDDTVITFGSKDIESVWAK